MVRTNIVLDETLLKKSMKLTGIKTRRDVVDLALRELVRHAEQMEVLKLKGKIHWEGDLKKSRLGRKT